MVQIKSLFVSVFTSIIILFSLLIFQTCTDNNSPTEPNNENSSTTGAISYGEIIEEVSTTIGTEGGTIRVTNSDSPIDGLTITVPQKGYSEMRNFTVSYASIASHDLGKNFNPVSPLITIKNGGGYSEMPMSIKIPIELEIGEFAIGFLYDEVSGKIEALPAKVIVDNSITVETRHFSTSTISSASQLQKNMDETSYAHIVISSITESELFSQGIVNSGFTPGFNDWEFINYGSYIAPGGHCAGQSITAMWYYSEKYLNGEPSLFHLFDEVNDNDKPGILWQDNPLGYRFASTIQEDFNWDGWVDEVDIQSSLPSLTWKTFIAAIFITEEPQFVIIKESSTDAGHAMIVYKVDVSEEKLYIADPNYPNNRGPEGTVSIRTIRYSNDKFEPYASYLKVGDQGTEFDQIAFFGKTANIDWLQIGKRYEEIETELIGDDRFPKYNLFYETKNDYKYFTDEIITDTIDINLISQSIDCPQYFAGTNYLQGLLAYEEKTGELLARYQTDGILPISLGKGKNNIGLEILGAKNNQHNYVDFKWLTVYYQRLSIEPINENGLPGEECKFIALTDGTEPKGDAKYVWSFGDNSDKITILNDSIVTHVYANAGTYEVTVELFENSTGKKLDEESIDFHVGGDPVITEIYDSAYDRVFGEKRLYSIPGNYFKIKGRNLRNVQKVYANGVEFEPWNPYSNDDSLLIVKMLPDFKGHVNIKVLAEAGESNEFPYLSGIPLDYITSSDSLRMEFHFEVKYYNSDGGLRTRELRFGLGFLKNELNWANNQVTINLNNNNEITGKSGYGTAIFTFSDLENGEIDKIVLDYTDNESYTIHYEEDNHYFGSEGIYLIRDNPHFENTLLTNTADMRYTTQPNISGMLLNLDNAEFSEIDLTVDSYYRRFEIELFHFR